MIDTKLTGVTSSFFKIGGTSGIRVKNSGSVFEFRNAGDSTYIKVRFAAAEADSDGINRFYLETEGIILPISREADCTSALPSNTGSRGYVLVTTAGTGAAIGDLLYDDGTSTGTMTIVAAKSGRIINVLKAFTTGTVITYPNTQYSWDASASVWANYGRNYNFVSGRQADCSSALPNNTASSGYVVVTTAGNGAVAGDLLWDNGSGSGTMEIVKALDGRLLSVTADLTGGTIELSDSTLYIWNTTSWDSCGDSTAGTVKTIRVPVTTTSASSTTSIPSTARIVFASFEVTTGYTAGATISVGRSGSTSLVFSTSDIDAQTVDKVIGNFDTLWGADAAALVTIAGSPSAGVGVLCIHYSIPQA